MDYPGQYWRRVEEGKIKQKSKTHSEYEAACLYAYGYEKDKPQEEKLGDYEAASGIPEYQKYWFGESRYNADMVFVVEGHPLPVHSGNLNDSTYVREHLRPGSQAEIVKVEDIFWDLKLEDMLEFLRFVYLAQEDKQLMRRASGVLAISRRLHSVTITASLENFMADKHGKKDKKKREKAKKIVKETAKYFASTVVSAAVEAGAGAALLALFG